MTNTDMLYLARCRKLIQEKLGWRPEEEWRNFEFTELSEKLLDATGISLSTTTLKRIFGKVNYQSLPSTATLNTLSQYLGYESWMAFKSTVSLHDEPKPAPTQSLEQRKPIFRKRIFVAALSLIVITAILSFIFLPKHNGVVIPKSENIVFKSHALSDGLPNTVVFNMDTKQFNTNNLRIQQSWDSTRTIPLQRGQTEATGFYYYPGYYRAKLVVDDKIVKEHDVFVRSDKWMATFDRDPVPTYIKSSDMAFHHQMTVSEAMLKEAEKFQQPTYLTYHLVKPFNGVKTDNFSFETSLKNLYKEGNAVCQTAKLFILGTNGAFIIPFTIPGCAGDINLKLYQTYIDGHSYDLSMFGTDLSDWNKINLVVSNRHVKIFLNDKLIKEQDYDADAGDVVGLRLSFLGAGAVRYVHLYGGDGKPAYVEDFQK